MALRTQSLLVAFLFASQCLAAPPSLAAPHVIKKDFVPTFPGASPPSNSSSQKVKRDTTLPSFPGYEYLSCYTDCTDDRTLQALQTSDPAMTIEMCAAFCNGYSYFGTEFGTQCFCDDGLGTLGGPAPATDCTYACAGDASEPCGGPERLTLYGPTAAQHQSVGAYQYQGCYTDSPATRVLTGRQWFANDMTLELCASYCASYEYFGTELGTQCFCGSSISGSQQTPDSECTSSCPGDLGEYCGAANRLSLFQNPNALPVSEPATVANFVYQGCNTDSVSDRSLTGSQYSSDSMTLESCASFCSGYTYFGVEYARECYCGNDLGGASAPAGDCAYPCTGDNSELCGAGARMNVYMAAPPAPPCLPYHLGCYYSNPYLQFLGLIDGLTSPAQCQLACANTPTCILTQYGNGFATSTTYYCNLFASDFEDTYDPNSEFTYAGYCDQFAFYTFDTCPVAAPAPV